MVSISRLLPVLLALGIAIAPVQGEPSRRIVRELNLTDQQLLEIRRIRQTYSDRLRPLQAELRQAQRELQTMLRGEAADSALRSKHQQITNLRQQISQLQFDQTLALREILTPSQRQQLGELIQRRRRRP